MSIAASASAVQRQNTEAARLFVAALTGDASGLLTFQTFPDAGESELDPLVLHGSLEQHLETLLDAQDAGHGVFYGINEFDGKGRREANVVGLRALAADDDYGTVRPARLAVPPSIIISSGHGYHYIWLLHPGEPLDAFTDAQRRIAAKLGTDPKVSDLPRVLRLPGTLNLKDRSKPRPVELVMAKGERRYTIRQVLDGLGAGPLPVLAQPSAQLPSGPTVLASDPRFLAERYVSKIDAIQGEHGDQSTFRVACALLRDFGLDRATAWECFRNWNAQHASPPWAELELGKKFMNAERFGKGPMHSKLASVISTAIDANAGEQLADNASAPDPRDYCFDAPANRWRSWADDRWDEGLGETALNRMLENNHGLTERQMKAWKRQVPVVKGARPIYSARERVVKVGRDLYANTYRWPTVAPCAGDWSPIREVLANLVNNDAEALRYVIGWLARVVQGVHAGDPRRIGTALVFHGEKGTGKGVLEEVAKALLGPWNVAPIGQTELNSDFNSFLEGKLLVVANEVFSSDSRAASLVAKMKDNVTCLERTINKKGVPQYKAPAVENWILNSNSHRPVEVEKGDRRFTIFRTGPRIDVGLGALVADDARAGGPILQAFLAHLLALPASDLVGDYRPLRTAAKDDVLAASGNSATKFAAGVRERGFYSMTGAWANGGFVNLLDLYAQVEPPTLLSRRLMDVYRAYAAEINAPAQQETTLLAALREEIPTLQEKTLLVQGRRERVVLGLPGMFPAIDEPAGTGSDAVNPQTSLL